VLDPSILKTERPPRHLPLIDAVTVLVATASSRAAFSRGSGFVPWPLRDIRATIRSSARRLR
jgi:hypothetical protein